MSVSVSFQALLFVGVPLHRVWEARRTEEKVRKYDPDTGEPREATVARKVVHLCGKQTELSDDPEWHLERLHGLVVARPHSEAERGDWLVGEGWLEARCSGYPDDDPVVEVGMPGLEAKVARVRVKLAAAGYAGDVGVYLVCQASY